MICAINLFYVEIDKIKLQIGFNILQMYHWSISRIEKLEKLESIQEFAIEPAQFKQISPLRSPKTMILLLSACKKMAMSPDL